MLRKKVSNAFTSATVSYVCILLILASWPSLTLCWRSFKVQKTGYSVSGFLLKSAVSFDELGHFAELENPETLFQVISDFVDERETFNMRYDL